MVRYMRKLVPWSFILSSYDRCVSFCLLQEEPSLMRGMLVRIFFLNLLQPRVIREEGTSVEKTPPSDGAVRKLVSYFLD